MARRFFSYAHLGDAAVDDPVGDLTAHAVDLMRARCPVCGRYVSNVMARVVGWGEPEKIDHVTGSCGVHGTVDVSDQGWAWEDFYPDD